MGKKKYGCMKRRLRNIWVLSFQMMGSIVNKAAVSKAYSASELFKKLYPAFYERRLRELGFEKIDLDIEENEGVSEKTSRRHNSQIKRDMQGGTMRDKFLLNRTATTWNLLPSEIAETDTANQFKAKIERHEVGDLEKICLQNLIQRNFDLMQLKLQADKVQRYELHSNLCVTAHTTTTTTIKC
ncbi:hypothetical protein BpHYR1_047203 [Brachionus plicatilis]|uniref:Uncharacterized protein n=1 Tax=Brachionus plicatilis TaxID=10195 RepID=A0A3M7RQF6_BRAPC|nr:hypothetical protein BpHYR1_047203 [Brachionus plicatilis]